MINITNLILGMFYKFIWGILVCCQTRYLLCIRTSKQTFLGKIYNNCIVFKGSWRRRANSLKDQRKNITFKYVYKHFYTVRIWIFLDFILNQNLYKHRESSRLITANTSNKHNFKIFTCFNIKMFFQHKVL